MSIFSILGIRREEDQAVDPGRLIEDLHRKYARYIYGLCIRMLGDRSEAEDAVQETFFNAYKGLASFRYGDEHLAWLYRIGTNVCLTMIRTRKRKRIDLVESINETAALTDDAEGAVHARQLLGQLMKELDERSLEIVAAHYVAGMDQGEVAQMLGISRRAVVKRLTSLRGKCEALASGVRCHE